MRDRLLHMAWQLLFFAPLAFFPTAPWAFFWAMQWFWPRELVDQRPVGKRLPVFPLGSGKWKDVQDFELMALILTYIFWRLV